MNLEKSSGSSSSNGQENGDGFNGSDRPLKKARFAWQVKGKYHLKNENNDPAKISTTESTAAEMAGPAGSGSSSSNSNNVGTEQGIETIDHYLLNKELNTLDPVVDEPDKSVFKPSNINLSIGNDPERHIFPPRGTDLIENLDPTRYCREAWLLSTYDLLDHVLDRDPDISECMLHKTDEYEPLSMLESESLKEDECIARWQTRQMAKGPIDNTVNSIMDQIRQNPLEREGDIRQTLEAFNVPDFINNLPGANTVENEGILMAISAHGLQNTSNSSPSSSISLDSEDISLPSIQSPALRISVSPTHSISNSLLIDSDDESQDQDYDYAIGNVHWSCSEDLKKKDLEILSPTFHGTSSLTFQNLYENLHNVDEASHDVGIENDNHRDFLDAAVSFAIQCKGLTTFGTEYG